MAREKTIATDMIQNYCRILNMTEKDLYKKTKTLLSIYRDVCWFCGERSEEVRFNIAEYASGDLDTSLIYLENFAPDSEREKVLSQVTSLFETRWLIRLMEEALEEVKEYPRNAEMYYSIIYYTFLSKKELNDQEMMERLSMEKSSYYDRKKEAIMIYGISLWKLYKEIMNSLQENYVFKD